MPTNRVQFNEAIAANRKIVYYDAVPEGEGDDTLWKIEGLPMFAEVPAEDERGLEIDRGRLEQLADLLNARAEGVGHYRACHDGHQDLRNAGTEDKPLIGFVENARVEDTTWGPVLIADIWGIDNFMLREFERGRFPFISIETDGEEFLSVAAMRSKPPHFPFPNIWVRRKSGVQQNGRRALVRTRYARDYRMQFEASRDKAGKFSPGAKGSAERRSAAAGESPDAAGVPHKEEPEKKPGLLKRIGKGLGKALFTDEDDMPDSANPLEELDDDSQFASDDEDTEQLANEMPPGGGTDQQPPDKLDQVIQMLGELPATIAAAMAQPAAPAAAAPVAAAPAPAAQMQTSSPDTFKPLAPASAMFANTPKGTKQREQFTAAVQAEVAKVHAPILQALAQQKNEQQFAAMLSEVKGKATVEEAKVIRTAFAASPAAARVMVDHIRTRGAIATGHSPVQVMQPPKGQVEKVLEQFATERKVTVTDADLKVARAAAIDWKDTMNGSNEENVRKFSLFYAGEEGFAKWISCRVADAKDKRKPEIKQFSA